MKSIAHDPVKLTLACAFLVLLAASLVRPPYPEYLWLQHVPTALASVAITLWDRRWPLDWRMRQVWRHRRHRTARSAARSRC